MPIPSTALALLLSLAPQNAPAPAAPQQQPAAAPRAQEDPSLAADLAILARLDQPFEARRTFRDSTAREVIDAVRAATGISVEIDRHLVGDSGGWEFVRVDCVASTPRRALDAVASALSSRVGDVRLEMVAGLPVFTDASSGRNLASVRHYDLRPLLVRRDGRDVPRDALVKDLMSLIAGSVDPEGWHDTGGDRSWMRQTDTTLAICTTPVVHHAIITYLASLESALPAPTVLWRIRIAEVAPEVSARDLAVVLDSGRELDALASMKGATVLSAPRILAARREPAKVSVGSGADSIEVSVSPIDGSDAFAVELKETRGGTTRTLMLRALEGVRGAGLLEGGGRRLLLEVFGGEVFGGDVSGGEEPGAAPAAAATKPQ